MGSIRRYRQCARWGVRQLLQYLDGKIDLETAAELAKRDTRAYAKRQFTFARHQLPAFQWAFPDEAEAFVGESLR